MVRVHGGAKSAEEGRYDIKYPNEREVKRKKKK